MELAGHSKPSFSSSTMPEEEAAHILSGLPDLEDIADLNIPLDTKIDVPAYLNAQFPDEQTLERTINPFTARLDTAMARLDAQLANLVRDHRLDGHTSAEHIESTTQSVTELHVQLRDLAQSAASAEAEVQKALEPARPLYVALENTIATAGALDALVALEEAVITLESATQSSSLTGIASNLSIFETIRNSQQRFEVMEDANGPGLRRLPSLRARAKVANETLRQTILAEFKRMSDVMSLAETTPPAKLDDAVARLRTTCAIAQAMGPDVKAELIGSFIRGRKLAFRAAFEMDRSGFSGTDKRFSWLRRELRANWARLGGERVDRGWGAVFPDEWGVARRLTDGIVRELSEWTSATLDAGADRDVVIMVSALSKTKEFEIELDRRFTAMTQTEGNGSTGFVGAISEAFGPWMGAYVVQEDEHLRAVLMELLRDETWVCQDGTVLKSATELFLVIKKSMQTCASLDVRQPLFSLHRVFRKHLASYASSLVKHLPGVFGNALADSSNQKDYDSKMRRACAIVSTAEYCSSTVEQLEESLRKTVQEVYNSDIDLSRERELFANVSSKGIISIVALLDEDLELQLKGFSATDWTSVKEVGDNSKYIDDVGVMLSTTIKRLFGLLEKHHFRFMLEKLAASFIPRYRDHIYKCKQMNNFGAQQILLDVTAMRALLLGLPASVHAAAPGTYVKFINREMGKIESVLKVVLAPVDVTVDTYVALVPGGTTEQLQRILEMKGLRRADAAPLELEYSRRVGPNQRVNPEQKDVVAFSRQPSANSKRLQADVKTPNASGTSGEPQEAELPEEMAASQHATVDSVKNLFGRLGTSLIDSGITDRLGQVSSQFESTTDRIKKEAAARGFRFGS